MVLERSFLIIMIGWVNGSLGNEKSYWEICSLKELLTEMEWVLIFFVHNIAHKERWIY